MIVRVFIPGPKDGDDYNGSDYDFEVMPSVGQLLRLTAYIHADFEVERVGFIQDGETFVASIWCKNDPAAETDNWIKSMVG